MPDHTILLIDYEPRSIEQARTPLAAAGFRVEVATDGVAGIEAFQRLRPSLVLIEAMLPKKHGFEVCQELKKTPQGKRTPILITTAVYRGRKYRSQAIHIHGCDEYVEKPIAGDKLVEICRRFIAASAVEPVGGMGHDPKPVEAPRSFSQGSMPGLGIGSSAKSPQRSASCAAIVGDLTEAEIVARLDAILPSDVGRSAVVEIPPPPEVKAVPAAGTRTDSEAAHSDAFPADTQALDGILEPLPAPDSLSDAIRDLEQSVEAVVSEVADSPIGEPEVATEPPPPRADSPLPASTGWPDEPELPVPDFGDDASPVGPEPPETFASIAAPAGSGGGVLETGSEVTARPMPDSARLTVGEVPLREGPIVAPAGEERARRRRKKGKARHPAATTARSAEASLPIAAMGRGTLEEAPATAEPPASAARTPLPVAAKAVPAPIPIARPEAGPRATAERRRTPGWVYAGALVVLGGGAYLLFGGIPSRFRQSVSSPGVPASAPAEPTGATGLSPVAPQTPATGSGVTTPGTERATTDTVSTPEAGSPAPSPRNPVAARAAERSPGAAQASTAPPPASPARAATGTGPAAKVAGGTPPSPKGSTAPKSPVSSSASTSTDKAANRAVPSPTTAGGSVDTEILPPVAPEVNLETPVKPALAPGSLVALEEVDTPPIAITKPAPAYTARARMLRQSGSVVLNVLVDENGKVGEIRTLQGIPASDLNDAAVRTVRKWTYQPAFKDGVAVKVWKVEKFNFQP